MYIVNYKKPVTFNQLGRLQAKIKNEFEVSVIFIIYASKINIQIR